MSKIGQAFKKGKAFIGFLTAGDPSLEKTYEYIMTMEKAGADLIEIGIPFPIPLPKASLSRKPIYGLCSRGRALTTSLISLSASVRNRRFPWSF